MKIYVGIRFGFSRGTLTEREVFRSPVEPSRDSHGEWFDCTVGPFPSEAAAEYFAGEGYANTCCLTPHDAERIVNYKNQLRDVARRAVLRAVPMNKQGAA